MFNTKELQHHTVLLAFLPPAITADAENMRPEAERRLAHDIYEEFIQIQSGYATGATTPVAEAAAARPTATLSTRQGGLPETPFWWP